DSDLEVRQVGDLEHEAPRERSEPAARRRNGGRLGRLHRLGETPRHAGSDPSADGARLPQARRRGKSARLPHRTTRHAALVSGHGPRDLPKETVMDLLATAKKIAERVEAESAKAKVP